MNSLPLGPAELMNLARIATQLEFFAPFKGAQLDSLLNRIELHEYAAGESIFRKGEPSDALYIVHEGSVVIRLGWRWLGLMRRVARLGPGDLFGEMGLLDQKPRSAMAISEMKSRMFVFLRKDFDLLMRENRVFAEGMQLVSERRKFMTNHT